jgi:hypothetical protein
MLALLSVATEFGAAKPWAGMYDTHVVGLTDPVTHDIRLGSVLGNAGEVFGVAVYRHTTGIRWLLNATNGSGDEPNLEDAVMMDCLKLEFLPKSQLPKADLNLLKAVDFKPMGKGRVWPQFQSAQPGWVPWHIDQSEAEQLLIDIPRIIIFCALFRHHPELYEGHAVDEVPFLPALMPNRPLKLEDLDWHPLVVPPQSYVPFQAPNLDELKNLPRAKAAYEYACRVLAGSTILEQGRPCYSRTSLLTDQNRGLVLGHHLSLTKEPFEQSAGLGLANTLLASHSLPQRLCIDDRRLIAVVGPLCEALGIELRLAEELPSLELAMESLASFMMMGP